LPGIAVGAISTRPLLLAPQNAGTQGNPALARSKKTPPAKVRGFCRRGKLDVGTRELNRAAVNSHPLELNVLLSVRCRQQMEQSRKGRAPDDEPGPNSRDEAGRRPGGRRSHPINRCGKKHVPGCRKMTRARGQSSRTLLDREYPHQVLVAADNVRGKALEKGVGLSRQTGHSDKKPHTP
jgi:hypothetical protein